MPRLAVAAALRALLPCGLATPALPELHPTPAPPEFQPTPALPSETGPILARFEPGSEAWAGLSIGAGRAHRQSGRAAERASPEPDFRDPAQWSAGRLSLVGNGMANAHRWHLAFEFGNWIEFQRFGR